VRSPPPDLKVRVGLDIFIPGGSSLGKMPKGDGWGIDAASSAFADGISRGAVDLTERAANAGQLAHLAPQVEGSGLNAFNGLAQRFGVSVGSGFRAGSITSSGNLSWHARGRARDFPGNASNMMRFAQFMAAVYGPRLLELIYTPLGFSIKNGARVAPYAQKDHYDHVHVAMQKGGRLDKPTVTLAGEDAPTFPEFYISTNPSFRGRSISLLAEAARRVGGRFEAYRSGGVKPGRRKVASYDDQIARAERLHEQQDRRYNLSEEEFIGEDADGNPILDQGAIDTRAGELEDLRDNKRFGRRRIKTLRRRLQTALKALRSALGTAISRLTRAAKRAKGDRRRRFLNSASEYRGEREGVIERLKTAGLDITDAQIDIEDLNAQIAAVRGTTVAGAAGEEGAPPGEPPPGDPPPESPESPEAPSGDALTPEQQAILDNADAISARNAELIAAISRRSEFDRAWAGVAFGQRSGDIGTGGFQSAIAAAGGEAQQQAGAAAPTINVYTLHPGDPSTLDAIGQAAAAGFSLQGSVISPRYSTGL
jgi:hypothetical protein